MKQLIKVNKMKRLIKVNKMKHVEVNISPIKQWSTVTEDVEIIRQKKEHNN